MFYEHVCTVGRVRQRVQKEAERTWDRKEEDKDKKGRAKRRVKAVTTPVATEGEPRTTLLRLGPRPP